LLASARRLFTEHGYAATTIEAIARDAGLAVQTFYATYGSKRAVLVGLLDQFDETGDVGGLIQTLHAAGNDWQQQLAVLVDFNARLFSAAIDLLEISRSAGEGDPDIAAVSRAGDGRRRAGQAPVVHAWARAGALRPGLDETTAAEILWGLTSPELFHLFVVRQNWPVARYASWLIDTLHRLLFA
jgi:AcrR family transcriptional regulator